MSLDNVVAIAAAAQDNIWYLIFGLLLSVPILVFSSVFVTRLLDTHPVLVQAGAALLGWIAGKTAVSDPAVATILETQSFGLVALAPVLGALYVLLQGRILAEQRRQPAAVRASAIPDGPSEPAASPEPIGPLRPHATPAPAPAPLNPAKAATHALDTPAAIAAVAPQPQIQPQAPPVGEPALKRFTPMDLTIMAGVAVPALGLIATLIYIIAKALASR